MAKQERIKTKYPGVFLVESISPATGKPDQIVYIRYKIDGKLIEEKAGRTSEGMTPARANQIRGTRMEGKSDPNTVKRAKNEAEKRAAENRWTVARIWAAYCAAHPDQSSLKSWTSLFNSHIKGTRLAEKIPSEIITLDIERLQRAVANAKHHRTGRPLAPQTVKHVVALLKRLLRWAASDENISVEPANHINFKKILEKISGLIEDAEKTEFMNTEERQAYLAALDEEVDRDAAAYFRIMMLTGIRKTALIALKWEDVDFQTGYITLKAKTAKKKKATKVPMSEAVREVLKSIAVTDSPYVWPGREGGQRVDFQRMARRVRDKAGLPKDFRPCHGLRHDYASRLASTGKVRMYMLQQLLTHGSAAMTARYAHLADAAKKEAAALADETLTASPNTEAAGDAKAVNGKE